MISNVFGIYKIMYSSVDKTFSAWLFDELKERGMSQADLSRATGITRGGISNLINQVRNPDADTIKLIARAFLLPPEDVFRAAGLLPPEKENDTRDNELIYLIKLLPENEKQQVLDYVRFMVEKVKISK